ncbi:ATP-binding protein [Pseudoalteromonas sp. DL2-H2.2]|uniref:ATP-binding protein n=1 Tax=Pseudoalteromonas sp. DL2-H2.2 TaxID=2908889 RepID=UPI001F46F9F8|nr:ATP-binding protein [Pseudoalteromonas sp. DL2-H2.2]MCF2909675.1 ATP-binding protein [Pseudoalteromonas sp. DL2-H2.2]
MSESLILRFDPNTIEHLGVSLYSKLPSVLSELISNSWDADANNIEIDFLEKGEEKAIEYQDDGEGMSFEELNNKYLVIGRNRRKETQRQTSTSGRPVIGKKGLGKLSVFGICDEIEVESVKSGVKNHFLMNLKDIKNSIGNEYSPEQIKKNEPTDEKSGTKIRLKKIRRKSSFELDDIALSLSKKFIIFDEMKCSLRKNGNDESEVKVTNELKYKSLNKEFEWNFPDIKFDDQYMHWDKVGGKVITLKTPVRDTEMRGIYLTSRGKIVNTASFYGARDNDQFHSYVTGYIEVNFIDDFDDDVISTDRHSLNWEHDETKELQKYLIKTIKKIGAEWKKMRGSSKKDTVQIKHNLEIDKWREELPLFERELSDKIINPILENANIDTDESAEIISRVIGKFDNESYKMYADKISQISTKDEDIPMLLSIMDDWKTVESKHYRDLATSRVEVIKRFENYLDEDTREVPTLHNFLKKFSWLLDPRILEFKDEVKYSQLLKESFPEEDLEEKNRRIDFLCSNALGDILYVIEIKRSNYKVDLRSLEQAYRYGAFLKHKYASTTGFSKVVCFVVGGQKNSSDYLFSDKERTYIQSGEVFVKTYVELLEQSKEYHKEFIEAYDTYNKSRH